MESPDLAPLDVQRKHNRLQMGRVLAPPMKARITTRTVSVIVASMVQDKAVRDGAYGQLISYPMRFDCPAKAA
jgi:hypothetical protein